MKRPSVYVLCFLSAGIAAGRYAADTADIAVFAVFVVLSAFFLVKFYDLWPAAFLPAAAVAGFVLCLYASADAGGISDLVGKDITAGGTVASVVYSDEERGSCFVLDASVIHGNRTVKKGTRIRVYGKDAVVAGDKAVVRGRLELPDERSNPSDLDYKNYLLARGQRYIMYADDILPTGKKYTLSSAMQHIGERVRSNFYLIMPKEEAGVMCTMLTGGSDGAGSELKELYKEGGIYHVIAISGLHISLLGVLLMRLFSRSGRIMSALAPAFLLGCYCILTGCSASVVRAVLMFYIMLAGSRLYCDYDIISSASVAACLILIYSPFYLFDIGFELSFGAVLAIGAVNDIAVKYRRYSTVINDIGVEAAADIATKPLQMFGFYYVNPWSIGANIMLVPLMSAAVFIGFFTAAAGFVSLPLAKICAVPLTVILRSVEAWCGMIGLLPGAKTVTGKPPVIFILLYVLLLVLIYNLAMRKKPKQIICLLAVSLSALFVYRVSAERLRTPEVTFLDVGQADCAVGTVGDHCFAVDGGSDGDTLSNYLMYRGIDRLDAVFVSHSDRDHIRGISEIMGSVEIDTVYMPPSIDKNEYYYELVSLAEANGTAVKTFELGSTAELGKSGRMVCLYPFPGTVSEGNNGSMVCKYVCGGASVLFTGDIEYKAEELLCGRDIDLSADILKLAHHGSDTSNTEEFIKRVSPSAAVASADSSIYGHPARSVTDRLDKYGIPCFVTDRDGAVSIKISKGKISVVPYTEGRDE